MSSDTLLAGTVMDRAASLLNDTAKSIYTYIAQLPYLQIALQELRELYELNSVSVTQVTTSPVLQMTALSTGPTDITFLSTPALPTDFIEPIRLWERTRNTDPYVPMRRVDFLPHSLEGSPTSFYGYFQWNGQIITVPAATTNIDIKMDYIRELFQSIVNENSVIGVINAESFLEYRVAALCAEFIERNMTSAQGLNSYALLSRDRALGIDSKSKQTIQTRRKPFRAGYKRRGIRW